MFALTGFAAAAAGGYVTGMTGHHDRSAGRPSRHGSARVLRTPEGQRAFGGICAPPSVRALMDCNKPDGLRGRCSSGAQRRQPTYGWPSY